MDFSVEELYSFFDVILSEWNFSEIILKARYTNSTMKAYKKDL